MKKLSLLSFVAFTFRDVNHTKMIKTLLLAVLFCVAGYSGYAQVSVTPASGGTGICPTQAVGGGSAAYTTLGTITVTEGSTNDISGTTSITLSPPSGWQFNTGVTPTTGFSPGGDILFVAPSYSSGNLVITIICGGTSNIDQFTISNLQIEATSTSSSAGNITATSSFITGITTGTTVPPATNFGAVSLSAGSAASVSIAASPSASICSGSGVTFTPTPTNGGTSPTYTWFVNGSSVGSGSSYSTSTLSNGDAVYAQLSAAGGGGCIFPATALSNTVTVTVNAIPSAVSASGGGSFCGSTTITASGGAGGTIYFQGTTSNGTSTATASTSQTVSSSGTYYFRSQSASGCWGPQGSVAVTINTVPAAVSVSGGSTTCGTNQTITASGGGGGTIYFQGTTSGGTSTSTPSSSQVVSSSGTYYFRAQAAGGCWGVEGSTTVTINPLPTLYNVTGTGSYCSGGTGVVVGLSGSDVGVNYQLLQGGAPTGIIVSGIGSPINFGPQTAAANYTVAATNTTTLCTNNMSGSATVSINPLPIAFAMTGGGGYCSGSSGVAVGLGGSTSGVSYQLFNGPSPVGSPVTGGGGTITFGPQTTATTYTAVATDSHGCTNNMIGSATVTVNALPTPVSLTGGGSYCAGGLGVNVGLASSSGVNTYQLYVDGIATGAPATGTGGAVSFGPQTTGGLYTASATTTATGCTNGMTGSVNVIMNPLPTVYTVIGGGGYCTGGTGVHVGLTSSDNGVNYQLFKGPSLITTMAGNGFPLDFGLQTGVGTYTVVATNATTGCTSNMTGSVSVSINPLPAIFVVSGGGSLCAGGTGITVNLSGSAVGVNYQLYDGLSPAGAPIPGTGSGIAFGPETAGGVYTGVAVDATTGCTSNMTGSATVIVNPLPIVYNVTGGGGYCVGTTGTHVGLSGSDVGISYELFIGGAPQPFKSGTGAALDFGLETTVANYTVVATNFATGCTSNMNGSVNVSLNPLPNSYTTTSFGINSYCAGGTGVNIFLSFSDFGISYQLYYNGSATGSPIVSPGGIVNFGPQTLAGTYTVKATDPSTGCTNNMTGSVTLSIDPLPTAYTVTGGGPYCVGGTGSVVGLSKSQSGVNYQLFFGGAPGAIVAGTGGAITFGPQVGLGNYNVVATDGTTGCTNNMTGTVTISTNPLPNNSYSVTGGGSYCSGGTGVDVQLNSSDLGINYQLYAGPSPVGSLMAGTGSAIDFNLQTVAGSYTVMAIDAITGCTNLMTGSVNVTINPLPIAYTVTGGGSFCASGLGVPVGLSNSETGVTYQLSNLFATVGVPLNGTTGFALAFGMQTAAGFYTVQGTNTTTGCVGNMTGGVAVTVLPLPTVHNVTGGGGYCAGGTGVDVALDIADAGINYELWFNGSATGTIMSGPASPLDFGLQTVAGSYNIVATDASTLCTSNMNGTDVISINALPTAEPVVGGGAYCAGTGGVHIFITSSVFNTSYQLFNGPTAVGASMPGTGGAIDFGPQTAAGTYTVVGTDMTSGCTNNMAGTATISINPAPFVYSMIGGGGYCAGGTGVDVELSGSDVGINYQLFNTGSPVTSLGGINSILDFGFQTAGGSYTVVATDGTTGCTSNMTGTATVTVNPLPTVYTISAGGVYCAGGLGVDLTLSGSDLGVNYQLWMGGSMVGTVVPGTGIVGSTLDLGFQTLAGSYTVVGTNPTTTCTSNMTGTATISINAAPTAYTISTGGGYCSGGTGIDVNLPKSDVGFNYELWFGGAATGTILGGTGSLIDFGIQTVPGTYTIVSTNTTTGCTAIMTGSSIISINPLPLVYTVSGGGSYCAGGSGVLVNLSNSDLGINYQTLISGVPGGTDAGTGTALHDLQTTGDVYTIVATNAITTCSVNMTGSVTITVNPLPAAITGITDICIGTTTPLSDATGSGVWSSSSTAIGTISSGGLVTGVSAGIYSISYTLTATGCMIASTDTVSNMPSVSTIVSPSALCSGYNTLFADGTFGGAWSSANTSIASIDAFGLLTGVAAGTTTVSYTVTSIPGCSTTVTTPITILASPTVAAISGSALDVCAGLNISLSDATPSGVWSSSNTTIGTVSSTGLMSGVSFGSVTISYTVTNLLGCAASSTYGVSVGNAMPTIADLPVGSATVCHGTPVNLSVVTSGGGLTYQWSLAGSDIPGATDANYTTATTGLYDVTVDNGTCQVVLPAINVILPPIPVIAYDSIANILYTGSFSTYQWYLDSVAIPGATSSSIPYNENGNFYVVVGDANGCGDTSLIFTVTNIVTNGVKQIVNAKDIKVYPNPATSVLYIDAPQKVFVTIMGSDGKMLMAEKEATSINIGQLPDGVYLIMIYDENNMLLKADKFVKIQ